jgi:hypothetical protein
MNEFQFKKILITIASCETIDQLESCYDWILNLRAMYNFSGQQKFLLNEMFIDISKDIMNLT